MRDWERGTAGLRDIPSARSRQPCTWRGRPLGSLALASTSTYSYGNSFFPSLCFSSTDHPTTDSELTSAPRASPSQNPMLQCGYGPTRILCSNRRLARGKPRHQPEIPYFPFPQTPESIAKPLPTAPLKIEDVSGGGDLLRVVTKPQLNSWSGTPQAFLKVSSVSSRLCGTAAQTSNSVNEA